MANIIAAIDPAGNSSSKAGMGETGIAFFEDGKLVDFDSISAKNYYKTEEYWQAVWHSVSSSSVIVCESFRLFAHKAKQQTGSSMETPQLIGHLRMQAWMHEIPFILQDPSTKARHADEVLLAKGFLELRGNKHYCMGLTTNLHERDAIRHGLYYIKYGRGK